MPYLDISVLHRFIVHLRPWNALDTLLFTSIGEAIYEIGVEDSGLMTGLSDEDLDSSLDTLREMARRLEATCHVLRERVARTEAGVRTVAEVLVRKVPDDQHCIDLRVCVLGSADVGKSTLLGVLTQVRVSQSQV